MKQLLHEISIASVILTGHFPKYVPKPKSTRRLDSDFAHLSRMSHQKNTPPRKKRPAASDVERGLRKAPGEQPAPAAAERTEPDGVNPATSEPAAAGSLPITNQDEQDKITNAASDDAPNV